MFANIDMGRTKTPTSINTSSMSAEEIVQKVESGELSSHKYNSFTEYVRAMEE